MVTITAPGVEIKEVDLSFYDFPQPQEETQNVLIPGFAAKGLNYTPYEFTNDNTDDDLIATFGTPTNEAERYFFNACSEAIKRDKVVLYATKLPYLNTASQNFNAVEYSFSKNVHTPQTLGLTQITSADVTLDAGLVLELSGSEFKTIPANQIEDYRTQAKKVDTNKFIIIDKTQDVYGKIPVDADHMELSSRYLLGVMPVVTTAANAMYFQNLIATDDKSWLSVYEAVGEIESKTAELQPSMMVYPPNSQSLDDDDKSAMTISRFASTFFPTINLNPDGSFDRDRLKNIGVVVFKGILDPEQGNKVKYEPVEAFAGSLKSDDVDPTTGVSRFIDDIVNTNSQTIELYSNCFNGAFDSTVGGESETLNDLSANVVDLATYMGIAYDSNELSDLNTISAFIYENFTNETISANESSIISNGTTKKRVLAQVKNLKKALEEVQDQSIDYSDIDLFYVKDLPTKILGFEEIAAADKAISYSLILNSLDKIFLKTKNVNEKQIDIVVDAGVSNIAQFIKKVNGGFDNIAIPVEPNRKDYPAGEEGDQQYAAAVAKYNTDVENYNAAYEGTALWCKAYDPIAYKEEADGSSKSAANLWDICKRIPGSTASVADNYTTDVWTLVLKKYDDFCKTRKDCMFFSDGLRPLCIKGNRKLVSPTNYGATVDNTINPFIKYMTGKIDTSYGAGWCDWYRIVDPTSDVNIWMPPSVKAMCVALDTTNDKFYWSVPAGVNNGRLNPIDPKSEVVVNDIAFNPTVEEAGSIYTKSWNYATYYRDDGYVLEGQRTFQTRPTAFDRINVRRLFLYLERKTFNAAKYFVYEPNTAYTRQRLVDTITPYFEHAKVNGGIYDYRIVCDETNNPPDTIDRNELHVKIAIKPTKAIEFIEVTFFALRTNASFSEAGI